MPCRTAGGCHIGLLRRNLLQKVLRFLHGADIRTDGHLHHAGKPQFLHGGGEFLRCGVLAELADKGRRDDRDDLLSLHDGAHHLIDLSLVHNGAEGTVHKTLTAGYAPVLIDHRAAVGVFPDGIHAADGLAGTFDQGDGVIGTGLGAFAAPDTGLLIDVALSVDKADGVLWADLMAGGGQTVLAQLRDTILL